MAGRALWKDLFAPHFSPLVLREGPGPVWVLSPTSRLYLLWPLPFCEVGQRFAISLGPGELGGCLVCCARAPCGTVFFLLPLVLSHLPSSLRCFQQGRKCSLCPGHWAGLRETGPGHSAQPSTLNQDHPCRGSYLPCAGRLTQLLPLGAVSLRLLRAEASHTGPCRTPLSGGREGGREDWCLHFLCWASLIILCFHRCGKKTSQD